MCKIVEGDGFKNTGFGIIDRMQQYRSRLRRSIRKPGIIDYLNPTTLISSPNFFKLGIFSLVGFFIVLIVLFVWFSRDLPTPGNLSTGTVKDSTKIYDKKGELLYSIYKEYNRTYIPLSDIPKTLKDATIATEDKDFYENQGFSPWAYLRVAKDYLLRGRLTGGSTITQQLVKNVLLNNERTFARKIRELILALQVDERYTKDEVLEMYLNNVPYGGTAVGVEAASAQYFDKHANELNLAQSAFLAGLPQSPTYYSPFSSTGKEYIERSKSVLRRMREDGYVSKKQEEDALKQIKEFKFTRKQGPIKAPHFVMYVRQKLIDLFGEQAVENGDLQVTTTLDYEIQKETEKILFDELEKIKTYRVGNGAVVVMDSKTAAISAMAGSKDYFDIDNEGNFNAAVALRQPGSSLKPIMYATAFEKGYTPSSLVMDVKTEFPSGDPLHPKYTPVNYDGKYQGPIQMRFALGNSINVPAVKMLANVGIKPVMQKAYDMGIDNWSPTTKNLESVGLSLVLGGREASLLQIASAYSVFANEGTKKEPYSILEVKDSNGKVLYKHQEDKGRRILSEEVAYLISNILSDNEARQPVFGPRSWLYVPGKSVAAKTGTTDSKRDNWTIGYSSHYVVGTWVGNNNNAPMNPAISSGVTGAAPIWNKVMQITFKGKKDEPFKRPPNIEELEIDKFGGGLPVDGQEKRKEIYVKGTQPSTQASIYKKVKVSREKQDRLANDEEIARGDYDVKDFIVFEEEDPVSGDGKNLWQEAINAWVAEKYKDDGRYKPPTERSDRKYDSSSSSASPTETPTPTPTPTGPTDSPTPTPTPTITPPITITP